MRWVGPSRTLNALSAACWALYAARQLDLPRRAAVDGLVQRSICGHLTEEMTERYSSVAQVEVEAALGKVVSLAGYRGLLRSSGGGKKRSGGKVVGKTISTPTTVAPSPSQVRVTN